MKNINLFLDFSLEEKDELLRLLSAKEQKYNKNDVIIAPSSVVESFGVLIEGSAAAYQMDKYGKEILLSVVQEGNCFATSLAMLRAQSPVMVTAAEDSLVLWLNIEPLKNFKTELLKRLFINFSFLLAQDVMRMNERIRIAAQPSIKKKLLGLLELYQQEKGEEFLVPMDRSVMAAYIGADRSALSRVISKMQQEKIISCNKNRFCILKEPF
jgi:CRP-like cAMP-binding protein